MKVGGGVEMYSTLSLTLALDGDGWLMLHPRFSLWNDPVGIVQESGWAPGLVWTDAENLASTRIQYPDCPARGKSLR